MAIITRSELESKFKNNTIPTQNDFKDMIDSFLNRKDDCFFGKWEKNRKYRDGSVVLYDKSLYKLVLTDEEEDCPPDDGQETGEGTPPEVTQQPAMVKTAAAPDDEISETEGGHATDKPMICSNKPPNQDSRWCMLEFQVEDDDWAVLDLDGTCVLVPKKDDALIGVGTGDQVPEGKMEINDPSKGKIILAHHDANHPAIAFENKDDGKAMIQLGSKYVEHHADTPDGFAFYKKQQPIKATNELAVEQQTANPKATATKNNPVLVVDATEKGLPRIGIGTTQPEASLDAREEGKGQVLLQPGAKADPEIVLLNLDPDCFENYLTTTIGATHAQFTTDAEGGFQFKKGEEYRLNKAREKMKNQEADLPPKLDDTTLMTITPEGKVGVGTETPATHVEVKHKFKGKFQMSFEKTNPAFSIINNRPRLENHLTIGTDNNFGIFMTDSEKGFKFKKAESNVKSKGTPDINFGSELMTLTADQKLGIGIFPTYHLDVAGKTRTNGVYLETDKTKVNVVTTLEDALKGEKKTAVGKICELNPVVFKWNEGTNCSKDGNHLGLLSHEVADVFPETIKTHGDGTQSVAYGNLVAVLMEAIKEQKDQINELTERVQKLEMKNY